MSLYGDYPAEWVSEPQDWYPGTDDDEDLFFSESEYQPVDPEEGWPYPDEDKPDVPTMSTFTVKDDALYERLTEDDDPVETDDPYDMRGWEQ